jgi:four helix bundle protein
MAFDCAMGIFEWSKSFPVDERYSLTDQIRRSSRSVCANIAEAWHRRPYPRSFANKLCDAMSEAAETQPWLQFAVSCGYLSDHTSLELRRAYDFIIGKLIRMMNSAEDWKV